MDSDFNEMPLPPEPEPPHFCSAYRRPIFLISPIAMWTAFLMAGLFYLLNQRSLADEIIFGTLILWILVETIKALTNRSRPFLALEQARVIGWRERGHSFPSGQTAQTFFLVTILSHQFQPGLGATIALYSVAVTVGFTRMYVHAHYPRDVLGGAVFGAILGSPCDVSRSLLAWAEVLRLMMPVILRKMIPANGIIHGIGKDFIENFQRGDSYGNVIPA